MNKWRLQEELEEQDNITNNDKITAERTKLVQKTDNVEKEIIVVKSLGTAHEPIRTKEQSFFYDGYYFYHTARIYKNKPAYYWYMRAENERKLYYVGKHLPKHLQNRVYE